MKLGCVPGQDKRSRNTAQLPLHFWRSEAPLPCAHQVDRSTFASATRGGDFDAPFGTGSPSAGSSIAPLVFEGTPFRTLYPQRGQDPER